MVVSIIRFKVKKMKGFILKKVWPAQRNMLKETEGFVSARLMQSNTEPRLYIIETLWESEEALEKWKKTAREKGGERMERMLRGETKMVELPYTVERYTVISESSS